MQHRSVPSPAQASVSSRSADGPPDPRGNVPPLRRLLAYRNPELIARFCKDYGVGKQAAKLIFRDLLRFLWLSVWARHQVPRRDIVMLEPMSIVDEMWHSFMTFSRAYERFGIEYFGRYLHHEPAPLLGPPSDADPRAQVETTVHLAWTMLGPSIARRWFGEYPHSYSLERIRRLQLEAARSRRPHPQRHAPKRARTSAAHSIAPPARRVRPRPAPERAR